MKRLGLIGGMSWESTAVYYRALNEGVRRRLGGLHSADLLLHSVDFAPIAEAQAAADWRGLGDSMLLSAQSLEAAGADYLVLCTNTMHKVADRLLADCAVPLLHVGDASGRALAQRGINRVALLGTRFTMTETFYRSHLETGFGISVLVPDATEQAALHRIIFEELCQGRVLTSSRHAIDAIMARLIGRGAEAVLLACTELGLLIAPQESPWPILDTTLLHVDFALETSLS